MLIQKEIIFKALLLALAEFSQMIILQNPSSISFWVLYIIYDVTRTKDDLSLTNYFLKQLGWYDLNWQLATFRVSNEAKVIFNQVPNFKFLSYAIQNLRNFNWKKLRPILKSVQCI